MQIQARLANGQLRRGDKLPTERALAEQFDVSRNTVREALRTLEISGFITLRRGASGGAFVAETDPQKLNNNLTTALRLTDFRVIDLTQAMRSVILMLFQAALPTITEDDLAAMDANIQEAEHATEPKLRSSVLIRFYRILAEATGNKVLVVIADVFVEMLEGWVARLGSLGGDRVIRSRREIVAHLRAGDTDAARRGLEKYLEELHEHWLAG